MKITRILKKIGKILALTILTIILVVIVLVVVALHSENTITRLALKEVSTMIEAPVKVDNVSLLLFRKFPYATVQFDGFTLGAHHKSTIQPNQDPFADTLVNLNKLYVSLKTRPLFKSKIEIQKIEVEGFTLNYLVDSCGHSNIDFLMASDTAVVEEPTDTTETLLDVLLSDLTVRNVTVNFSDQQMKASARVHIPELNIEGKVLNEYYAGRIDGSVLLSNLTYEDYNVHLMNQAALSFNVGYDDGNITIESANLVTDGASMQANGKATMGDSIYVDMGIALTELNLKEISKYAPVEMLKEFGLIAITGQMDMEAKIKGYVYDTLLLPHVQATMSLKRGSIITTDYPEIKHVSFAGSMNIPNPNDFTTVSTQFTDFRVATAKSHFDVAFSAANLDKPSYNVKASGKINLDEFSSFIPDSTVEYLTGTLAFNMATRGVLPDDIGMESADYFLERTSLDLKIRNLSTALDSIDEVKNLTVDFSYKPNKQIVIKDLSLEAPGYGVALQNSSLKGTILGYVRDMDNMGMDMESYYLKMGNNIIEGKTYVKGLNMVDFKTDTRMALDFEELVPFMPDSLIEHISGKALVEIKSYGNVHMDSIEDQAMKIAFEQTKLMANLQNFSFEMFGDTLAQVKNLSLDFAMADDTIRIDNLFGHAHGIDFWMDSTEVWNAYKAFMLEQKDQTIIVNTHIKVGDIDYAPFAYLVEEDTTQLAAADSIPTAEIVAGESSPTSPDEEEMYIPPYIVRGTMAVNSVKYGNMLLQNLSTLFRVDESLYVIDKFKLDAFGGSMVTSAVYDTRNDSLTTVMFKNEIFGMDIHQMLVDGENFGQEDFTHENISGKLTSSLDGRVVMQDTTIFYDKIIMKGDLKLEDGGIYNFEPLMEVGKFTNLRELENLVFRTLETSIFIHKNNIYFPKTSIVSSAVDMAALGVQSFDSDYQYHITLFLRDVLLGKSDNLLKQQGMEKDGFKGDDQSDRKGLFLVAMDRNGEKRHRWDQPALRRRMESQINVQSIGLGLVFNPRLVNYSTDLDRREGQTRPQDNK